MAFATAAGKVWRKWDNETHTMKSKNWKSTVTKMWKSVKPHDSIDKDEVWNDVSFLTKWCIFTCVIASVIL